ncbi:ABC transporter ATP-binding protein [Parasedimentitalea psychrophila]|uniref:ABC transporter ATP-binding protein n=1 Tax=Parasedimentitalea psychrophila TaxID=2997337 RepID=A0A9Y2L4R8_9RHOB|nr:ABC transporter ATP-binding protein [Parasedimentitalea psychrophila]WIY27651.1 ABC transporter ATP-binding protein [Parasedimentitalea psychrophila]
MLLCIRNLSKCYPGLPPSRAVLRKVSLDLEAGKTIALTGESGSGKSTLLHLIAALDHYDSGEIKIDGTSLTGLTDRARAKLRRTDVAMVFQQFNLVPSLTVEQNILLHASLAERVDLDWITTLTRRLGLADLTNRYPEQLSGGQQQRVAIGRALAVRPKLLLADEPTGNLDETASAEVLNLMLELVRKSGTSLFLVTHSVQIANQLDRRIHLSEGKIQ